MATLKGSQLYIELYRETFKINELLNYFAKFDEMLQG